MEMDGIRKCDDRQDGSLGLVSLAACQMYGAMKDTPLSSLPFRMAYDTHCGKKEKYNEIVRQFADAKNALKPGEKSAYLVTLIDTIEQTSMEIYERYRELVELFKSVAKDCFASGENDAFFAYAMLKACRLGVLLKEKYAKDAVAMAESLLHGQSPASADAVRAAVLVLLDAQVQLLKGEME